MKINLSRILAAVAPAMLAIFLPAASVTATGETITLGSSQGTIGQTINIQGSGFASGNGSLGVNILFGQAPMNIGDTFDYTNDVYHNVQIFPVSSNGTFSTSFQVPSAISVGGRSATTQTAVARGNYYIYITYYYSNFNPPNGTTILAVAPFSIVAGLVNISPTSGTVGSNVTISGTYFGSAETINMDYDGFPIDFSGDAVTDSNGAFGPDEITIPTGAAGQHTITVTGATSGIATQVAFTVKPKISISPSSGPPGQLITAIGTGFGKQTTVTITFGGAAVTTSQTDANGSFSAIFPASNKAPGDYNIVIGDAAGNSASAGFSLLMTAMNVTPTSGKVGSTANVSGSNFLPGRAITITLDDTNVASATSSAEGAFNTIFTVPAKPAGAYKLTASDGSNNETTDFSVQTSLNISPLTTQASPGYVGMKLTISGSSLSSATVSISYDGAVVATTTASSDGTFSTTFTVPPSAKGQHTIAVNEGGQGSETAAFFMESTAPPTPAPLKPEMGIETSATPAFQWQAVSDPSGVTYELQVAASQDFSTGSIVLEKTSLTSTQYTLLPNEQLASRSKASPYYWHIRAVDGAGNASPWSGAGAFYIGGGLSQTVIYLLIGIGALIVILFAFWLGRRIHRFNE